MVDIKLAKVRCLTLGGLQVGRHPGSSFQDFTLKKDGEVSRQIVYARQGYSVSPQNSCPESLLSHEGVPSILSYTSGDNCLLIGGAHFRAVRGHPFGVGRIHSKRGE